MARGLNMGSAGIALLGLLAVKGFQHRDQLGKMLGDMTSGNARSGAGSAGGLDTVLGNLGGMLGGNSQGSTLNHGLGGLLDRFRQSGNGEAADSWVTSGPNRTVEPSQLEAALGEDVIEHLEEQTGLSRSDLLQRLSTNLPQTVDQLTPDGRVPTEDEYKGWTTRS